ncbi:MAG: hypothetical protein HZB65_03745 [Candidatus Aenigmarchaeota archaeon]|nr:hypothetical protein [Candidatus Aenigmarchaeota archaeon]
MGLKKVFNVTKSIVTDEPLNYEEKFEVLERKMNVKFSQFEDSMSTIHSVIMKVSEENAVLKEENLMLKKMMADREAVSTSFLGGVKEKLVKPIMKEGHDFAELVFKEDDEKESHLIITPEPELSKPEDSFPGKGTEEKPLDMNSNANNPREKTIKWIRQKFGLSARVAEPKVKQMKAKTAIVRKERTVNKAKTGSRKMKSRSGKK